MKLKITVTKKSDSSYFEHLEFEKFPVVIGREDKNEIVLPDIRKVISRAHAKMIESDGLIQLIDLGSANFTYLNELTPLNSV